MSLKVSHKPPGENRYTTSARECYRQLGALLNSGIPFKTAFQKVYSAAGGIAKFTHAIRQESDEAQFKLELHEFIHLKNLGFHELTQRKIRLLAFNYLRVPEQDRFDKEFINFALEYLGGDALFIQFWKSLLMTAKEPYETASEIKRRALNRLFNVTEIDKKLPALKIILQKLPSHFDYMEVDTIYRLLAQENLTELVELFKELSSQEFKKFFDHIRDDYRDFNFLKGEYIEKLICALSLVQGDTINESRNWKILSQVLMLPRQQIPQIKRFILHQIERFNLDLTSILFLLQFFNERYKDLTPYYERLEMPVSRFRKDVLAEIPPEIKPLAGSLPNTTFQLKKQQTIELDFLQVRLFIRSEMTSRDNVEALLVNLENDEVRTLLDVMEGEKPFSKETTIAFIRLAKTHKIHWNLGALQHLKTLFSNRFEEELEVLNLCEKLEVNNYLRGSIDYRELVFNRKEKAFERPSQPEPFKLDPLQQELLVRGIPLLYQQTLLPVMTDEAHQDIRTFISHLFNPDFASVLHLLQLAEKYSAPTIHQIGLNILDDPKVVYEWLRAKFDLSMGPSKTLPVEIAEVVSAMEYASVIQTRIIESFARLLSDKNVSPNEIPRQTMQLRAYLEAPDFGHQFTFTNENQDECWCRIKAFVWLHKKRNLKEVASLTWRQKTMRLQGETLNHLAHENERPSLDEIFESKEVSLNGTDSLTMDNPTRWFLSHSSPFFKSYFSGKYREETPMSDLSREDWELLEDAFNYPEKIDPENALTLFSLSNQYHLEALEERCFQLFTAGFELPSANDLEAFKATLPLLSYPQERIQIFYKKLLMRFLKESSKEVALEAIGLLTIDKHMTPTLLTELSTYN